MNKNTLHTKISLRFVLTIILFFPVSYLFAGQLNYNVNSQSIALHGYDPVSYFQDQATEGIKSFSYKYNNINYIFSSEKNLKLFIRNPDKHIPVFGGYCAYGVRVGKKFDIDPNVYAIVDDKLYLLLDRSTKNLWEKDRKRNIAIAERLWPTIKSVTPSSLNN